MKNNLVRTSNNSRYILCQVLIVLGAGLILFVASVADAATLSVSPQTGVQTVGSTFSVQVRLNTAGQPVNAAEGSLTYDPQKLQVVGISKGTIFNLWTVEPTFSNASGKITFGGGSPAGYTGSAGGIMNVSFRAVSAGNAKVSFSSGSALAADGRGTNVLSSMGSAAFTIAAAEVPAAPEVIEYVPPANTPSAPKITSQSHPDPAGWSRETTATLNWTLPAGVTAVRTLLSSSPSSVPTKVYETPISEIEISDLDEGISYFHIQFKNEDGWGTITHYRLAVDTGKPEKFDIALAEGADLSDPAQILQLTIVDETSEVKRFAVKIDGDEPYEYIDETGSSTIALPELEPGYHTVIIEAFDEAGNSIINTFSFSILAFDRPQFTEFPSQINSEVIPVIKGVTRPDAKVTVSIRQVGVSDTPRTEYELTSDQSGIFTFIPDARLNNGVYELVAVATDTHGAKSEPSAAIRIAVQDPGYIQIGSLIVSVLSIVVPLLALLLLLMLSLIYFFARVRRIRTSVTKETKEALGILEREFAKLQALLAEKSDELQSSRRTKKLTKAEADLVDSLTKAMESARVQVAKEVDEVDDIVT